MNSFDIDGVVLMGPDWPGVRPGPEDVIITGRSVHEAKATLQALHKIGITNQVFFNHLPFDAKTRESSGQHKAKMLQMLYGSGYYISIHFEDDPIQADIIEAAMFDEFGVRIYPTHVVRLVHDLTEKENLWHAP